MSLFDGVSTLTVLDGPRASAAALAGAIMAGAPVRADQPALVVARIYRRPWWTRTECTAGGTHTNRIATA